MSKCIKSKNPCKICLTTVTPKTGLQCQGACESWVHYSCLNYTPGKVKDIKAGIIKITCPCPDCKTSLPKEYRVDEPYSCSNMMCPANRPPQCTNAKCPTNVGKSGGTQPAKEKMIQTPKCNPCPPCPLSVISCGNDCKQNLSSPLLPPAHPPGAPPPQLPVASSSDTCFDFSTSKPASCPSGCTAPTNFSGDARKQENFPALGAMEQMCNTIGLLSNQMNSMMAEMRNAVRTPDSSPQPTHKHCGHASRASCPKPCYCPNNPGRKQSQP